MSESCSRKVGKTAGKVGVRQIYEVRPTRRIYCDRCGRRLASGEWFTRRSGRAGSGTLVCCRTCRPFVEPAAVTT